MRTFFILLSVVLTVSVQGQTTVPEGKSEKQTAPSKGVGSDFQYKCYPNPFSHNSILSFTNPEDKRFHLYLIDVTGRVVRSYGGFQGEKIEIRREGLPPGVYLFELRAEVSHFGRIVLE